MKLAANTWPQVNASKQPGHNTFRRETEIESCYTHATC
jgi:hypothetical protein